MRFVKQSLRVTPLAASGCAPTVIRRHGQLYEKTPLHPTLDWLDRVGLAQGHNVHDGPCMPTCVADRMLDHDGAAKGAGANPRGRHGFARIFCARVQIRVFYI
jgi:hypothetical protein